MSSTHHRIVRISAAVAALVSPALATPAVANAPAPDSKATPDAAARQALKITVGDELMSFTVGENDSGMVVADHSSHASHASHSSHSSHYSSR
jgi:hypothetical protein